MQNKTKNEEPLRVYVNGYHGIWPVHITAKTVKYGKVIETIRASYLLHADEQTKVFMNNIEELGCYIQKSTVIIKGNV